MLFGVVVDFPTELNEKKQSRDLAYSECYSDDKKERVAMILELTSTQTLDFKYVFVMV